MFPPLGRWKPDFLCSWRWHLNVVGSAWFDFPFILFLCCGKKIRCLEIGGR